MEEAKVLELDKEPDLEHELEMDEVVVTKPPVYTSKKRAFKRTKSTNYFNITPPVPSKRDIGNLLSHSMADMNEINRNAVYWRALDVDKLIWSDTHRVIYGTDLKILGESFIKVLNFIQRITGCTLDGCVEFKVYKDVMRKTVRRLKVQATNGQVQLFCL